jgi:hypothetical protein
LIDQLRSHHNPIYLFLTRLAINPDDWFVHSLDKEEILVGDSDSLSKSTHRRQQQNTVGKTLLCKCPDYPYEWIGQIINHQVFQHSFLPTWLHF